MGDYLKGKVAIVTGSGMGIGRAVADAFRRDGAATPDTAKSATTGCCCSARSKRASAE